MRHVENDPQNSPDSASVASGPAVQASTRDGGMPSFQWGRGQGVTLQPHLQGGPEWAAAAMGKQPMPLQPGQGGWAVFEV